MPSMKLVAQKLIATEAKVDFSVRTNFSMRLGVGKEQKEQRVIAYQRCAAAASRSKTTCSFNFLLFDSSRVFLAYILFTLSSRSCLSK